MGARPFPSMWLLGSNTHYPGTRRWYRPGDNETLVAVGGWHVRGQETLGKYAHATSIQLQRLGWVETVWRVRGKPNVAATVRSLPHKAARVAEYLRTCGAPVVTNTPPWTQM